VLRRPLEPRQYLSIRYTERLAQARAVTSVGSRGDSYDNALAETIIGLYKTELIRRRGPWKGIDKVEYATAMIPAVVAVGPDPVRHRRDAWLWTCRPAVATVCVRRVVVARV
jgi:transposase InsO family protein